MELQYINNQSSELCKKAIYIDRRSLLYVKEQTSEICKYAVSIDSYSLKYIKNQTKDMCLIAIENDYCSLFYVKDRELFITCLKITLFKQIPFLFELFLVFVFIAYITNVKLKN